MLQAISLYSSTGNGTGATYSDRNPGVVSFQLIVEGTGTVGASAEVQASLTGSHWLTLGTLSATGSSGVTDGFTAQCAWASYRAVVTGASGTISKISVLMSEES